MKTAETIDIRAGAYWSPAVSGRLWGWWSEAARLPLSVLAAVDCGAVRAAVDVVHTRFGGWVARIGRRGFGRPAVLALRKGILWHLPHVSVGHERVERRRILVLVRVVLIDRITHAEQILFEDRFPRVDHARPVLCHPHRRQNHDQGQHDEKLDHREAALTTVNLVIG